MNATPGRHGAVALAALLPLAAWAHGGSLDWHVPASESLRVLLPLLAAGGLYAAGLWRREALSPRDSARSLAFFGGLVLLAVALVWPLDAWAGQSFAAHMAQHMVLLAVAPPLLVIGRPGATWLRGLPARLRRPLVRPRHWPGVAAWRRATASVGFTGTLHAAALWGWHIPALFELALRNDAVHWLEHVTLLASGWLFWRALFRAREGAVGWGLAAMLGTVLHSGVLGALLTLAPRPLYGGYGAGPLDPLQDQQLAGLIMWVPMGTVYLVAALAFAGRALRGDEAHAG